MKNEKLPYFAAVTAFVVFVVLGLACATPAPAPGADSSYKPATADEKVIGSVRATFEAQQGYAGANPEINEAAYIALLEAAQNAHQGNIDVRNIRWTKGKHISGSPSTAVWAVYEFTANGSVVSLDGVSGTKVEGALENAAKQTVQNVPKRSTIAIVYITALDQSTADFIVGELEYIWVNDGFKLVDRSQLDKLRNEQKFQMSGEVDDATAVSIGKFAGADIIVTGRVDGEGSLRRLRLRALDTQTAQVVGAGSERL